MSVLTLSQVVSVCVDRIIWVWGLQRKHINSPQKRPPQKGSRDSPLSLTLQSHQSLLKIEISHLLLSIYLYSVSSRHQMCFAVWSASFLQNITISKHRLSVLHLLSFNSLSSLFMPPFLIFWFIMPFALWCPWPQIPMLMYSILISPDPVFKC